MLLTAPHGGPQHADRAEGLATRPPRCFLGPCLVAGATPRHSQHTQAKHGCPGATPSLPSASSAPARGPRLIAEHSPGSCPDQTCHPSIPTYIPVSTSRGTLGGGLDGSVTGPWGASETPVMGSTHEDTS